MEKMLLSALIVAVHFGLFWITYDTVGAGRLTLLFDGRAHARTLVVYGYFENLEAGYRDNLEYFLAAGVGTDSMVDYVVVLSGNHSIDVGVWRRQLVRVFPHPRELSPVAFSLRHG